MTAFSTLDVRGFGRLHLFPVPCVLCSLSLHLPRARVRWYHVCIMYHRVPDAQCCNIMLVPRTFQGYQVPGIIHVSQP